MSRQTRYYLGRPSGFAAEIGTLPDVRLDPRRAIPHPTLDVIAKGSARGNSRSPPRVASFCLGFGFRSFIRRTLSLYEIRPPPRAAPPPEIRLTHIAQELKVHFRLPGGSAGGRRGSDNGGIHGYASGATFVPRRPTSAISGGGRAVTRRPCRPTSAAAILGSRPRGFNPPMDARTAEPPEATGDLTKSFTAPPVKNFDAAPSTPYVPTATARPEKMRALRNKGAFSRPSAREHLGNYPRGASGPGPRAPIGQESVAD